MLQSKPFGDDFLHYVLHRISSPFLPLSSMLLEIRYMGVICILTAKRATQKPTQHETVPMIQRALTVLARTLHKIEEEEDDEEEWDDYGDSDEGEWEDEDESGSGMYDDVTFAAELLRTADSPM